MGLEEEESGQAGRDHVVAGVAYSAEGCAPQLKGFKAESSVTSFII